MKTRIKDKEHLEQIFRKYAELDEKEFSDDLEIDEYGHLTLGDLKEICECIGYQNLLLDNGFFENIEQDISSYCSTIYIDLIGIKEVNFNGNNKESISLFGSCLEYDYGGLHICNDGTLRFSFV